MNPPRLAAVVIGGDVQAWRSLGFAGDDRLRFRNGSVAVEPTGAVGIVGFTLHASANEAPRVVSVDGVRFEFADVPEPPFVEHSNGAFELDHVVVVTDSLDRTCAAVETELGLPLKRVREVGDVRQGFHRFADVPGARGCIIEVVESSRTAGARCASPWGLVVNVHDLDAAAEHPHVGEQRDAVQPGRRIATVSRAAGLGTAVALMTP